MDEKTTYGAIGQAVSDMKIEDDGTADRKILIAVDFGTTFSGVAWAQTRRVWDHASYRSDFVNADILDSPMSNP